MNNAFDRFIGRLKTTEERINEVEDRSTLTISYESKKLIFNFSSSVSKFYYPLLPLIIYSSTVRIITYQK